MAAGAALGPLLVAALGVPGALVGTGVILPAATLLALASLGRLDARAVVPGAVFSLLRSVPFLALLPVRSVERMARHAVWCPSRRAMWWCTRATPATGST